MELFITAKTSLEAEQYILRQLKGVQKSIELAREVLKTFPALGPIYKITITVEQVEPKL